MAERQPKHSNQEGHEGDEALLGDHASGHSGAGKTFGTMVLHIHHFLKRPSTKSKWLVVDGRHVAWYLPVTIGRSEKRSYIVPNIVSLNNVKFLVIIESI